jgi:hypothetical protein
MSMFSGRLKTAVVRGCFCMESSLSLGEDLSDVFLRLAETSSVEASLSQGVRLACRSGGCLAGAIAADWEFGRRPGYRFRYDPDGLLEQSAFDQRGADASPASSKGGPSANGSENRETRILTVPLCCGDREAGRLVLLAPRGVIEAEIRCQLAAIAAALAVLLLAVQRGFAGPPASILSRDAFRASLSERIVRSDRRGDTFSVLHVRTPNLDGGEQSPWLRAASLGELLLARLRRTDLIGLMAPDHLAVLLAGTGRLGARIAARRIELLLCTPESRALYRSGHDSAGPLWCVRTFPEDARSPAGLCDVDWREQQTAPTTMKVRVP